VAVGVPAALLVAMVALPFYDRRSARNLLRRPLALGILAFLLAGSALLLGAALRDAGPRVPAEVGQPLTTVQRAGRALYRAQKCDDCHAIGPKKPGKRYKGPELTEVGLHHSVGWLHSFIEAPERFRGDTTEMSAYGPPVLSHQEIEELAQYLSTLRGKAEPSVQPEFHDTFPEPPQE
jgi:mono/diheme cytochrome c family protein